MIDPELGASIVKLGLIYDIAIDGDDVTIVMTLTTQGCPMQDAITAGVERVVRELSCGPAPSTCASSGIHRGSRA